MPVLHKYKDREKYYVLTSISGSIVTFQLTDEGHQKLLKAGIKKEDRSGRALLFDLYRTGEAFTHGTGQGRIEDANKLQLALDFPDDSEPESIFPACSVCTSINDLHFVEVNDKEHFASIYCSECRKIRAATINTSIPLPLINRGLLSRMLEINNIQKTDNAVTEYQKILETEFTSKWEEIAKTKPIDSKLQKQLFESEDDQGRESLNFQISMTIYAVIAGLLAFALIGFVILPVLVVVHVVFIIVAIVKTNKGESYRYPLTIRIIK